MKIRKVLVDWRSKPQAVISIVGASRISNTSLARRLYEDPSIVYHFPIQAWTTVSPLREFNERQLLFQLLGSIDSSLLTSMSSDEDADHLGKLLCQKLKGQRYLIVIDGIRTQKAWDDIQRYFPDDLNGSRILMTTGIMGVAKYASSSIVEVVQGNTMIGLEDEFEKIRDLLIFNHHEREVISIVGRGGAGKTTLAQKLYYDPLVLSQFEIRAWITLSQEFSVGMALLGIIGCIVSVTNEISKADDTEYLADRLRNILSGQRYLIVIDDIGTTELWDHLQTCFPNDLNGSRIIITTETMSVAGNASRSGYIYEIGFLTSEESWDLFVKTLMFNPSPEHESIGRKIVGMCGGLPLSIVICAGILANHKMPPEHSEITALIYNNLPSHLRACFLYLGIFPKGSVICVKKLIKLWMAEGFLVSKVDKSLEDIAQDSLNDLITRSILIVEKWSFDGKVESCRIRDWLHDFCLKKAQEDNTLVVINEYCGDLARTWSRVEQSQLRCRWMSCQSHLWPITESSSFNYTLSKIRSILHFGKDLSLAKNKFIFPCLKLLRVLDLSLVKCSNGMPSEIVNLIHLRYLALTTTGSLYNFQLFKLQNLQTLILSSWMEECPLQLPCDILNLPWLRHVHLDKGSSLYLPNSIKGNLQTLFWLKVACWGTTTTLDFTMVPNLKELGIYMEGEMSASTLHNLTQLYQLQILKFEMGRVKHFYIPPFFPPNIKKLSLRNTNLSWEEMDIIGKLSNLEVLKLKEFAFCGPKWEPGVVCFSRLKFLHIVDLDLKHWNASADNFPVLECLVVRCCCHLKDLPIDMAWISSLKLIELIDCCPSLVKSAMRINQKQIFSCGTDGLVVRHSLTKDELAMEDENYEEVGCGDENYEEEIEMRKKKKK
ncbi:PREDICTED: putative late blight resistance protein homolog R1B-14 [Ipomoea nil]|uniref:putative late blight resistance protein homolog R1B-14 n=1 Tax=Ipomoea nil TaxID=35883 RepID=UPI000901F466|nr:PREDICTED: putative late blight resistance protein homolog R1B-14 [Ipomoea nil]